MTDRTSSNEQRRPALIFEGGRTAAWILPAVLIAILVVATNTGSIDARSSLILCLSLACLSFWIASRRWRTEFDLRTRRLKVFRRFLGRWTKTIVDCPLDQCRALGRIEYETEGHPSYGVYVELADGTRHDVPLRNPTIQEAGRVAAQLTEATGISRLDTKF